MSTVIAFPDAWTLAARRPAARSRDADEVRTESAEIVILPVVRVERYDAHLPGPVPRSNNGRRAR
ncbi:hypothetical protein [Xanthobacter autotrophicus]|uniref:hypothetical protein n=1 Tax=Xanthobacter autotrophicus TaxID=280 RepID=UPI0024A6B8D0|nr:hypothetical protein [Xanthobacter autotrophicus]MDI4658978.1 hypothetical protein [Xanthobacter autotrophicus]